ncbi:MAG: hypothetical protein WBM04_12215 [Candidatus Korobacteraceae bacterium]
MLSPVFCGDEAGERKEEEHAALMPAILLWPAGLERLTTDRHGFSRIVLWIAKGKPHLSIPESIRVDPWSICFLICIATASK